MRHESCQAIREEVIRDSDAREGCGASGEDFGGCGDAGVEATVQRARPVVLTALAAVLAFIP